MQTEEQKLKHELESVGAPGIETTAGEDWAVLPRYLREHRLGDAERLRLCLHLVELVAALHDRHFVHGGIQTDRVFVASSGAVLLAARGGSVPAELSHLLWLRTGAVDDAAYFAPEQLGSDPGPADERTDVYGCGVVLCEVLNERLPFEACDPAGWVYAHLARDPAVGRANSTGVGHAVERILLRCLAKSPDQRYQRADDLARALRQCIGAPALVPLSPLSPQGPDVQAAVSTLPVAPDLAHTAALRIPEEHPSRPQPDCPDSDIATLFLRGASIVEVHRLLHSAKGVVSVRMRPLAWVCARLLDVTDGLPDQAPTEEEVTGSPLCGAALFCLQAVSGRPIDGAAFEAQTRSRVEAAIRHSPELAWMLADVVTWNGLCTIDAFPARRAEHRQLGKYERELCRLRRKDPQAHAYKHLLLQAEMARLRGSAGVAERCYEDAAERAARAESHHYSGVINERAARFFLQQDRTPAARAFASAALDDYAAWGAQAKVRALEREFAALLSRGKGERRRAARTQAAADPATRGEISTRAERMTAVQAAQALSREVVLPRLLRRLMTLAMESAGADHGTVLLARESEMYVELSGAAGPNGPELESVQVPASQVRSSYPAELVDAVRKQGVEVVLDDASVDKQYALYEYVAATGARSILCAPMTNRGDMVGVICLENRRLPGVFTSGRADIVRVLASQAAISIDNARLYGNLEQAVAARTRDLEVSRDELAAANDQLLRAQIAEREMLANIAHDLRTPVTLVTGYAEALADGLISDPGEIAAAADKILGKTQAVARLIEELEQLEQLDSDTLEFDLRPVPAEAVFARAVMEFRPDIENAGLQFVTDGPHPETVTETWLVTDEPRLLRAISNLVYNAVRHTPPGGRVTFALRASGGEVSFYVSDTGTGIAQEDLPRIFDRFYKVEKVRTRSEGSGLGLAITKQIVQRLGGRIRAESELGRGSTFVLTLPLGTPAP